MKKKREENSKQTKHNRKIPVLGWLPDFTKDGVVHDKGKKSSGINV